MASTVQNWYKYQSLWSSAFILFTGVISIYSYTDEEIYYNYQEMHFNRYNGNLIRQQNWDQKNSGEKLIGMNYDIHVGAIGGLTGKIIAFLASLVSASLPITGFYIWWIHRRI